MKLKPAAFSGVVGAVGCHLEALPVKELKGSRLAEEEPTTTAY